MKSFMSVSETIYVAIMLLENTRGLGKQYHNNIITYRHLIIYSALIMKSKKYFIKEQSDVSNWSIRN